MEHFPTSFSASVHRLGSASLPHELMPVPKKRGRPKLNKSKDEEKKIAPPPESKIFEDTEVSSSALKKAKKDHENMSKYFIKALESGTLANMYQIHEPDKKNVQPEPEGCKRLHLKSPTQFIISGMTGSGKTNFLLNIEKAIWFDRVFLFAKDSSEHLYEAFVKELKSRGQSIGKEIIKVYNHLNDFPNISQLNETLRKNKENALLIVDDMINENPKDMKNIFNAWTLGRKGGIWPVWIGQRYFGTPKIIRDNSSFIALGRLASEKDMKRIIREFPQLDITPEELSRLYKQIQQTYGDMNFLSVDINAKDKSDQFRLNLAPGSIF